MRLYRCSGHADDQDLCRPSQPSLPVLSVQVSIAEKVDRYLAKLHGGSGTEEAMFNKQTRVLELVIRRVPHVPDSPGGGEPLPSCGVRRAMTIPRIAHDAGSGRWKGVQLPVG